MMIRLFLIIQLFLVNQFVFAQSVDDQYRSIIEKALDANEPVVQNAGSKTLKEVTQPVEVIDEKADIQINKEIDNLEVKSADINDVLDMIVQKTGIRINKSPNISGNVTIYLRNIAVRDALRIILDANNLAFKESDGVFDIMTGDEYKMRFNHSFSQEIQTKIIPLLYKKVSDVIDILNQMKSFDGKIIHNQFTNTIILMDEPNKLQSMVELLEELDLPTETKIFSLKFVKAKDIARDVQKLLTKSVGRVDINEEDNSLSATDTLLKLNDVEKLILDLDREQRDSYVLAKVVEIILNEEHNDGVDWEAIVSDFRSINFMDHKYQSLEGAEYPAVSVGTLSAEDFQVLLESLDAVGAVENLSDSRVEVANYKKSKLPIILKQLTGSFENPQKKSQKSLELEIEPIMEDKEFIQLALYPKVNLLVDLKDKKEKNDDIKNIISIRKGATIVVGGFFDEVTIESVRKIPLLGDLPLLGFAFRNERQKQLKAEVIVFLTPEVNVSESQE